MKVTTGLKAGTKYNFSIDFTSTAQDLITKVKGGIENSGGTFLGDEKKGDFSFPTPAGTIKGIYTIKGQNFAVGITDKPFFVPGSAIEPRIRTLLGKA